MIKIQKLLNEKEEFLRAFERRLRGGIDVGGDYRGELGEEEIKKIKEENPKGWEAMKKGKRGYESEFIGIPETEEELKEAKRIAGVAKNREEVLKRLRFREEVEKNFERLAELYGKIRKYKGGIGPYSDTWIAFCAEELKLREPSFEKLGGLITEFNPTYHYGSVGCALLRLLITLSPLEWNEGIREIINASYHEQEKDLAEHLVYSLALDEYPEIKKNLSERAKKFIELLRLSREFKKEVTFNGLFYDFITPFSISKIEGREVALLQKEDRIADYDPPYIESAWLLHRKFDEYFSDFGLEAEVASSLGYWDYAHGPYHYVDLTSLKDELYRALSKESLRKLSAVITLIEEKEKKREEERMKKELEEKEEAVKELIEKYSREYEKENFSEGELRFVAEFLVERSRVGRSIGVEDIKKEGNYIILSERNYHTYTTRSSVTDYVYRKFYVFNPKKKEIAVSGEESGLFRTTEMGLTGFNLNAKIDKVLVTGKKIEVVFQDGGRQSVDLDFKPMVKTDPEVKKKIEEQIKTIINKLKDLHRNLKIPLPLGGTRPADAGIANIEYEGNRALVTIWEEIDYWVGGRNVITTQKRIRRYEITPEEIKEIGSKTTSFEEETL